MMIIPAIAILDGRCVRLTQGRSAETSVYFENPLEAVDLWCQKGAKRLHMIDLNGAFDDKRNKDLVKKMIKRAKVPVQVGGGIRSLEAIDELLNSGAERVIVGTAAVSDFDLLEGCISVKDKVIVSIDAVNGRLAVNGWVNVSGFSAYNFARKLVEKGFRNIVYTDIARDGAKSGPDTEGVEKICSIEFSRITAAGGVRNINDLLELREAGAKGIILGRAIYDGELELEEAIKVMEVFNG